MKIAVVGLWHLGSVTAACLAKKNFDVIAYDDNETTISVLQNGQPPVFEPELENFLKEGIAKKNLVFTHDINHLHDAPVVWVTIDVPVDEQDVADVAYLTNQVKKLFPYLQDNTVIILSSQIPAGTTHQLKLYSQENFNQKNIKFVYIPENLRLGKAISIFMQPDRIVIGLDDDEIKPLLMQLLSPFSTNLVWMSVVSAEMTKHAINSFLALSVTFINELAVLCEAVGANAKDVERGLKSEERIGPKAYLRPGNAISGGTLMRDIKYLTELSQKKNHQSILLSSILDSNRHHEKWICRKLTELWQTLHGKKIAILGLTYKMGTNTLRRSLAIELCQWLHEHGVTVNAYDPLLSTLAEEHLSFVQTKTNVLDALHAADAVIISTEWPQFRELTANDYFAHLKQPYLLDPSGFVSDQIKSDQRIKYFSVGASS